MMPVDEVAGSGLGLSGSTYLNHGIGRGDWRRWRHGAIGEVNAGGVVEGECQCRLAESGVPGRKGREEFLEDDDGLV
jgi:hypothetical protein